MPSATNTSFLASRRESSSEPRLDEAPAAEVVTLATSTSISGGASQRQSVQADETEQKAAAGATATWVESTTTTFPTLLPMEHEHLGREFYVRSCYSKYYEYVLGWLSDPDTKVVAITGTPGIGKSVFYAYFWARYSFEKEGRTIVTASFDSDSVMRQLALWKGGEMLKCTKLSSEMEGIIDAAEKAAKTAHQELIHLYDGPPDTRPLDAKMVCFTSPNDKWFNHIRKNERATTIVMPLWTMKELETAAVELDLMVRGGKPEFSRPANEAAVEPEDVLVAPKVADLVEQRFQVFGGVARACLSRNEAFVKKQQHSIETTVKKFKDILGLQAILDQEKDHEKMYHSICHWVPNEVDPTKYTIAEPTPFMKKLLFDM